MKGMDWSGYRREWFSCLWFGNGKKIPFGFSAIILVGMRGKEFHIGVKPWSAFYKMRKSVPRKKFQFFSSDASDALLYVIGFFSCFNLSKSTKLGSHQCHGCQIYFRICDRGIVIITRRTNEAACAFCRSGFWRNHRLPLFEFIFKASCSFVLPVEACPIHSTTCALLQILDS